MSPSISTQKSAGTHFFKDCVTRFGEEVVLTARVQGEMTAISCLKKYSMDDRFLGAKYVAYKNGKLSKSEFEKRFSPRCPDGFQIGSVEYARGTENNVVWFCHPVDGQANVIFLKGTRQEAISELVCAGSTQYRERADTKERLDFMETKVDETLFFRRTYKVWSGHCS